MNNSEENAQNQEPQVLHYFNHRNASLKFLKNGDVYIVIQKKYIFGLFKWQSRYEFKNYFDAEDKFLEMKSILQYRGMF